MTCAQYALAGEGDLIKISNQNKWISPGNPFQNLFGSFIEKCNNVESTDEYIKMKIFLNYGNFFLSGIFKEKMLVNR